MMNGPSFTKYRKRHKGHMAGRAKGGDEVSFGDFGLQVTEPGYISARQLEAARVAISRSVKKLGKIYIRLFPDRPVTKKPAETRRGTGKGAVEYWVARVKPGRVICEVEGVDITSAKEAFHRAHHKLPIKTHLISREPSL